MQVARLYLRDADHNPACSLKLSNPKNDSNHDPSPYAFAPSNDSNPSLGLS